MGAEVMHTGFEWGNMMERGRLQNLGVDMKVILKWTFTWDRKTWTGLSWLRIGTGGGLL
jgi:hypothetical protein